MMENIKTGKNTNRPYLYKNNGDGTFTDVSEISNTNIAIDATTTRHGVYRRILFTDNFLFHLSQNAKTLIKKFTIDK